MSTVCYPQSTVEKSTRFVAGKAFDDFPCQHSSRNVAENQELSPLSILDAYILRQLIAFSSVHVLTTFSWLLALQTGFEP